MPRPRYYLIRSIIWLGILLLPGCVVFTCSYP
jgi:hypothetical protein